MATDSTSEQIKLKDSRMLGYCEFGAPNGKPVFYFHGHPGSRRDWSSFDSSDAAAELKARVIAVDRPGHGLSDFKPDREILDWPDDVTEHRPGPGPSGEWVFPSRTGTPLYRGT